MNYKDNNITLINPESIIIDDTVVIGKNVIIHPNNILKGHTIIEDNVELKPNNYITDSLIKSNVEASPMATNNPSIG
mgnify:CR=1 FL=1